MSPEHPIRVVQIWLTIIRSPGLSLFLPMVQPVNIPKGSLTFASTLLGSFPLCFHDMKHMLYAKLYSNVVTKYCWEQGNCMRFTHFTTALYSVFPFLMSLRILYNHAIVTFLRFGWMQGHRFSSLLESVKAAWLHLEATTSTTTTATSKINYSSLMSFQFSCDKMVERIVLWESCFDFPNHISNSQWPYTT